MHGSSLVALPNDELLTVFYGGYHESSLDVKLYQARYRQGKWEPATPLISPGDVGQLTKRYTRRVGNSSLFRDAAGKLHLFFCSVGFFGWSCSSVNQMTSSDNGQTWSASVRLLTSPLFNISTLVRSPAVPLADGGFLLPVYYELTNKFPEVLEFDAAGTFVRKQRMSAFHGSLQACLVPINKHEAHAYLRNRYEQPAELYYQKTSDGGRTWSSTTTLAVENRDSCVAAVRVEGLGYLLAYNPSRDRDQLRLTFSRDGLSWKDIKTLEQRDPQDQRRLIEYSYPTMLVQGNIIDLFYTWNRQGFKHLRFTTDWVKEQIHD